MSDYEYDLVAIGSGPAGQRAAIQAAKLGKRVAIVERKTVVGGVCVNTGTIPSKTLREAILHLSGYRERSVYGASYAVKKRIQVDDLFFRTQQVIRNEIDVTNHQLYRNDVDLFNAGASFADPHTLRLNLVAGTGVREITAENIVIATGTYATDDKHVPRDGQQIFTSDDVLRLNALPRTLAVVGAGVIGCEYACLFATLGVRVTLIDKREQLLPFVDREISATLAHHMRDERVTLRLGEDVREVDPIDTDLGPRVRLCLKSGKEIVAERALYSVGRTGATDRLNLPAAGVTPDDRGRLIVNERYQTEVPHIFGVGDVIGFPSLASTSMEQGRIAACHAFNVDCVSAPGLFPYGIYTIPEISMVGRNEEELTAENVPYEVGRAHYREIARGQIIGDRTGLLKIIFHLHTRQLLGIHIIGDGASELIHIGQAVLAFGGTVDYFVNTVFNYPTLAECYKTAAFDGINRLAA
jgi:NAD(P) transhydrogenase